MQSVIVNVCDV